MNFNDQTPAKKVATLAVIAIGLVLVVRLGVIAYSSRRVGVVESPGEFRDKMKMMHEAEKEELEALYKKSGKPLPPGGIDALFKYSPKLSEADLLPSEQPDESGPKEAATTTK